MIKILNEFLYILIFKKMNSENSSEKLQETINELNKKLLILKNALLEERKKTNKLEEEVNNLNNKISEKDEIILNYKNENESLNDKINKLNQNENSENEINTETLQKENQKLQNDLTIFKDQNGVYKLKLELLTSEIENFKKESNNEIEKLKKDLENEKTLNKINIEKQNGIENISKIVDSKKTEYENKFTELIKTNNDLEKKIKTLIKDNNEITLQNKVFIDSIAELKNKIEIMGDENYSLNKKLEDKTIITKDFIFRGTYYIDGDSETRKQIKLCFGKYENRIEMIFEGEIHKNIQIKNVTSIKKIQNKKGYIIISFFESNEKIRLICQFTERECEYIIKFFYEIKGDFIENKEKVMMMALNSDNYTY